MNRSLLMISNHIVLSIMHTNNRKKIRQSRKEKTEACFLIAFWENLFEKG